MKKRSDGLYQKQITIEVGRIKKQKCFYGKTIAEVNRKILAYEGEVEKGRTFGDVAAEWWEEHQKTLEYNTVQKAYKSPYDDAMGHFKNEPVKSITAVEVNNYVASFVKKKLSGKTVISKLQTVRQILDYALLKGEVEYNVALAVKIPKNLPKTKRELPTQEDIDKIKNSHGATFSLFAMVGLYTGCRRGEILALRYEDINFVTKEICIDKSVYFAGNRPFIKQPKTEAGIRRVPLLKPLEDVLCKPDRKGYIINRDGEMLTDKQARQGWDDYCKEIGLEITPHQLRHAYATRLYELGVDEKSAQELMGHSDIATTRNIYTHISEQKKKAVAEQLKGF